MKKTVQIVLLALLLALPAAGADWTNYADDFSTDKAESDSSLHSTFYETTVNPLPEPYLQYHGTGAGRGLVFMAYDDQPAELGYCLSYGAAQSRRMITGTFTLNVSFPCDGDVSQSPPGELFYAVSPDGIAWSQKQSLWAGQQTIPIRSTEGKCYILFSGDRAKIDNVRVLSVGQRDHEGPRQLLPPFNRPSTPPSPATSSKWPRAPTPDRETGTSISAASGSPSAAPTVPRARPSSAATGIAGSTSIRARRPIPCSPASPSGADDSAARPPWAAASTAKAPARPSSIASSTIASQDSAAASPASAASPPSSAARSRTARRARPARASISSTAGNGRRLHDFGQLRIGRRLRAGRRRLLRRRRDGCDAQQLRHFRQLRGRRRRNPRRAVRGLGPAVPRLDRQLHDHPEPADLRRLGRRRRCGRRRRNDPQQHRLGQRRRRRNAVLRGVRELLGHPGRLFGTGQHQRRSAVRGCRLPPG